MNTRNTDKLRARRKKELTERLLGAVERLHDSGEAYSEISVERLIREAGVTRSTFYSHFDHKDSLLSELASGVLDELLTYWTDMPSGPSKVDLRQAIGDIFEAYLPHRAVMVAIDEPAPDSEIAERFTSMMGRSTAAVADRIRTEQARGAMATDVHPETLAELLMWMTERGLAKLVEPDADILRLADSLTEIFWRAWYGGARP